MKKKQQKMTKQNKTKQSKAMEDLRIMHLALAQERDYLRSIVQSLAESRIAKLTLPSLSSKARIALNYINK